MPHLIVEYSKKQVLANQINQVLAAAFQGALDSELFSGADIKTRAIAFEHFNVGNSDKYFIHVTAKILSGRSLAQRQSLSVAILSQLNELALNNTSCTVEVVEIERASYAKLVS